MRRFALYLLSGFLLIMVGVPVISVRFFQSRTVGPTRHPSDDWPITIYLPQTKTVETLPLGEYVMGVVAAELPPTFTDEAVKAQFVASRTYAVRRMARFRPTGQGGCPLNPQADLCADSGTSQAYKTKEQLFAQLGAPAAAAWWARLEAASQATAGQVLHYDQVLIDPLYHSVSGRLTENAADYYGTGHPYLQPVDDHWGQSAGAPSQYLLDEVHFTLDELTKRLDKAVPALATGPGGYRCTPDGQVEPLQGAPSPVKILSCTETGRVKTVQVAGLTLSGRAFREELGLRSTDFQLQFRDGLLYVQTHGWGHGLGMSQWGANGMAQAGKRYAEILAHYYPGTTLDSIE
ncbi:MAG TPA: stage II sporulation protein D [Symbiobacteriaceae bacterium]|nr:stage II sporulation protein D [Symbiobacteriaceae bacterium]